MFYRLKHIPTGLYYQPFKQRGSNLSKTGKVYQTSSNGLSEALKNNRKVFTIFVDKDSVAYRVTKDKLEYAECMFSYNQMKADTLVSDWVKEDVIKQ